MKSTTLIAPLPWSHVSTNSTSSVAWLRSCPGHPSDPTPRTRASDIWNRLLWYLSSRERLESGEEYRGASIDTLIGDADLAYKWVIPESDWLYMKLLIAA